ncbi:MAG: radical SAM protein [Elusimicrobiota bacterium]
MRECWRRFARGPLPRKHLLSLYVHVPYCIKKCHFCYCSVKASPSKKMLDGYLPGVQKEADFFSSAIGELPVRLFQVGGGTPNILSADQLGELFGMIRSRFYFDPDCFRTIEFNPASTTADKLLVARKAGFQRVSFGAQSLNESVLNKENREYQNIKMTADAVRSARLAGFDIINIDLILGLEGEDAESFKEGLENLAHLEPSSITITAISLTDPYLKVSGTTREDKLRKYEKLLPKALDAMRQMCSREKFRCDDLSPNKADWVLYSLPLNYRACELMKRNDHFAGGNLSVMGLGPLSWSHIFGEAIYMRQSKDFSADLSDYRFAALNEKEEMMRYVLYSLAKKSKIYFGEFMDRFGQDARVVFGLEIAALGALGKIKADHSGLLFLPARGPDRIFYGLFFLMDAVFKSQFANINESLLWRKRLENELSAETAGKKAAE